MRNVWNRVGMNGRSGWIPAVFAMILGVAAPGTARAQEPIEINEDGMTLYIYPEEFDGDEWTAEAIVRLVDWRTGFEGWVYAQVRADGEVETWEPTISEPMIWEEDAVKGPGQRYYDGVDCWDTPALNVRYGRLVKDSVKRGLQGAGTAAFRCTGAGLLYWNCVAFAGVTPFLTTTIWDTGAMIWTCYVRR